MIEVVVVFVLFYVVQSKKWPQGASVEVVVTLLLSFPGLDSRP